jgi:ankyrin repeat protein
MSYSEEVDTQLLIAVMEGRLDNVKRYIGLGADIHVTQDEGRRNPLRLAAIRSYMDIVKYIVEELEVDPGKDTRVLQMTTMAGNNAKEIFKYLIDHGGKVDIEDKSLGTSLMIALREGGDEEFAKWIIEECGADVTVVTRHGEKSTALHKAVQFGTIEMIEYLISKGADKLFNVPDGRGFTPLTVAADESREDVIRLLISKYGVDPNFITEINPLFIAVQKRLVPVVELLMDLGSDANITQQEMKCNPLHLAASNDYQSLAIILCEHGANVDCEDPRGYTPLIMAASEGYSKMIQILCQYGADYNHRAHKDNATPLFHAVLANRLDATKVLLELGCHPLSIRNEEEETLADMARKRGHNFMANLLEGWLECDEEGRRKLCGNCCKHTEAPKICTRCRNKWYCSQPCQKADWRFHKLQCKK